MYYLDSRLKSRPGKENRRDFQMFCKRFAIMIKVIQMFVDFKGFSGFGQNLIGFGNLGPVRAQKRGRKLVKIS